MEFATTVHRGLLLLNGRYDGKHNFIAVEVWQGQVWFRFSLFSHEVIVTSNVNGGVIDGNWHKVEVAFQNRVRIFFEKICDMNSILFVYMHMNVNYILFHQEPFIPCKSSVQLTL